ncbi:MAG: AMP-binding protein, partial [Betaproteobacteria bacterium]
VGGMQAFFIPHMMVGGTNIVIGHYDAVKTLETIQAEQVTTLFAVPTQIQEMLLHPRFAGHDVRSLRMITTGGAAIAAATMERVISDFCPNIFNGYGMTEASLALLLHPEQALSHLGSCGKPTLISTCRVVEHRAEDDAKPDDTVASGEIGQLIVRGPQVTWGYWNNPVETAKKLRSGWLYTGDLVSRDDDGFYHFCGRVDDMIVSGGENIYPREVEEILYRCPGVQEAAVVGLPDEKWGSVVTAFVVPRAPGLDAAAIAAFCRASHDLASYKRPRRIVFVDALPTNPSGKVLKRELIAHYSEKVGT